MIRRLFAMIRNEFQREFAYPVSILFFLILPLIFTAAVGAGLGGMMESDEAPEEYRTRLYVASEDEGPLVTSLLDALGEVNLAVGRVETLPEETFGLEIPAEFSSRLRDSETVTLTLHTLPTSSTSQAVEQYVRAAVGRLGGAVLIADMGTSQAEEMGAVTTEAERRAFFDDVLDETLEASQNPPAVAKVRWPEGVEIADSDAMATGTEQASAGQIVTWVQITLLGAAEVLVDERLRGTMKRMLVTPAGRATILSGKLLARLALGLVQMTLLLGGGALIFNVGWGENPVATGVVSGAFALATVGLGMLVATFVRTRGQANSVVVGMSMAMAALGGAWYPLEVTPPLYRQIVKILPSTWAMQAYTDLLARGATTQEVLPYVAVLLGFAVVFTALGIWRFRRYE